MEAGHAGRFYIYDSANTQRSDTSFYLNLSDVDKSAVIGYATSSRYWSYENIDIHLDSERTIAWLKNHLGLEVKPYESKAPLAKEPRAIG